MKVTKRQLRRIIKEFYSVDVEEYLRANAVEYRRDPNLDSKSIRMLLMDDFMDNIGHSEDIVVYQSLIDSLASGEIVESKILNERMGTDIYKIVVRALNNYGPMTHQELLANVLSDFPNISDEVIDEYIDTFEDDGEIIFDPRTQTYH